MVIMAAVVMAVSLYHFMQLIWTVWWNSVRKVDSEVSDLCYPLGRGVSLKASSTGSQVTEPVVDLSQAITAKEVWPGHREYIPDNMRVQKVIHKEEEAQQLEATNQASTSRSLNLSSEATCHVSTGGGHGRLKAQQKGSRSVFNSSQERNTICCLSLQSSKGSRLYLNADVEAALPTTWDPLRLASYICEHGTDVVTAIALGARKEHLESKTEHEQGRHRKSTTCAHLNGTLPMSTGVSVNLDHSITNSGSATQTSDYRRNDDYGNGDEAVVLRFETVPQSDLVRDPDKRRHLENATFMYKEATKTWGTDHDVGDPMSIDNVRGLEAFLSFQQARQTSKANSESCKVQQPLQSQAQPQKMTRSELFSEGIGFARKQYFVNLDPVRFRGGVPVDIDLCVTGLKEDILELVIERTNEVPSVLEPAVFEQQMMSGEWHQPNPPQSFQEFRGIKVDCREVYCSEKHPGKVHILTGARLVRSKSALGEVVLSMDGYFSDLENARFIRSKWISSSSLRTASSAPATLPHRSCSESVESYSDHFRSRSLDQQRASLAKHVAVDSSSMGADQKPGHWVLSGFSFCILGKQLGLLRRFSLYEYGVI